MLARTQKWTGCSAADLLRKEAQRLHWEAQARLRNRFYEFVEGTNWIDDLTRMAIR